MRFATIWLVLAGCSVEFQGLSSPGLVLDGGDHDDTELDARSADDSNGGDGDTVVPGADASNRPRDSSTPDDDSDEDDSGVVVKPPPDAATPVTGFQPPIGQIGSRCSAAECSGALGAYGGYCAKSGQPPIGSDTGYCTRSCTSSGTGSTGSACGQGSICVTVNGAGTCQRTCADDSDCRIEDGYYCASSFPLLLFVCWHR